MSPICTTLVLPEHSNTMKSINLIALGSAVLVAAASDPAALYDQATQIISTLPDKYDGKIPLYNYDNVENNVHIPQYNRNLHQYEGFEGLPNEQFQNTVIPLLNQASLAGHVDASVDLGDIYMYGNHSVPANYSKALEYYSKAVSTGPNGHAYFMLGYMYSTGMFGEVPVDRERSNLYYEFAAENGDFNALLVLANKHHHGIGRPANCELAQFYYSRAARVAMKHIHETGIEPDYEDLLYNVKIVDFNGGLYGQKVSESASSVVTRVNHDITIRNSLREDNLNDHDHDLAEYYFDALEHYHGGYFLPRNRLQAFHDAQKCVSLGKSKFGGREILTVNNVDRYIWSRCLNLLGHMYLRGQAVQRNPHLAYKWLKMAPQIYETVRDSLDLGLLHKLDPTTDGVISDRCADYLRNAAVNGSAHGAFNLAKWLVIGTGDSPFKTSFTAQTYDLMRSAAFQEHYEAIFYFADAVESGFAASVGESFSCSHVVLYYKAFVERSESFLLPHLEYAFNEFAHGNFKNALMGYLMAAEQGMKNAQVSTAFLLYQRDPLFTFLPKAFEPSRVHDSLIYLELASAQDDIDATVLLGDLHYYGIPSANFSNDYLKAFAYYSKAALAASPHGSFKLGHMYEYGLGSANNSVDYFMAKRYYDLSIKFTQDHNNLLRLNRKSVSKANTYPISLALLRLRVKLLFSREKKKVEHENTGWFSTFKELGRTPESTPEDEFDRATAKAQAHHEGGTYEEEDEYEIFDYVILFVTFLFFLFVFVQNMQRQYRRLRQRQNGENPEEPNNVVDQNGVHIRRGNFEFHFFAL